jgi:hypothetical protein
MTAARPATFGASPRRRALPSDLIARDLRSRSFTLLSTTALIVAVGVTGAALASLVLG